MLEKVDAVGGSRPHVDGVTVYLDFVDQRLTEDNIRRIIAFPDTAATSFALLGTTRLHRPKVDLRSIPARFIFANLSELFTHWERITASISDEAAG